VKGTRALLAPGLVVMVSGAVPGTEAQAPPAPSGDHPIHIATYIEVLPSAATTARAELRCYRDATRREPDNRRCEVLTRIGQPHHFVVLAVWASQAAWDAHGRSPHAAAMREKIQAVRGAPVDDRVHVALSVGPLGGSAAGDAVYVVTHVDVIPPRKDDGLAALVRLAEDSRAAAGNLRYEVVQQANRPNHFTVVEVWRDAGAVEAHAMAEATRRFRDALGPMSGALYDERLFRLVE
jgi:quinol monooxygenase YgiN